jgi:hypothetical protein
LSEPLFLDVTRKCTACTAWVVRTAQADLRRPGRNEIVVDKNQYCDFSGNDLEGMSSSHC